MEITFVDYTDKSNGQTTNYTVTDPVAFKVILTVGYQIPRGGRLNLFFPESFAD
jgi:hypothetical protein